MNENKIMPKIVASSIVLTMGITSISPIFAYSKDETVYSKIDMNGNEYEKIVSEHLKNTENAEFLKDVSELLNIENVNGDTEPIKDGNSIQWKALGEDIYYQGNTEKELPIEQQIKYKLDGNEISANDIIGKSGKVEITIKYENKLSKVVNVNGKDETMYVPFVVMTGTVLDNSKIKNIQITNGKVIDNGQKTFAVAMACPGLIDSLSLSEEDLPNFDEIQLTFDVKEFEMGNIMSYVTPKLFEESDISKLDKFNEIYNQIEKLEVASKQLVNGNNSLEQGAKALNNGIKRMENELNSKINVYHNVRQQASNKQQIEKKIAELINSEMKKMLPELEKEAKQEAENAVKKHQSELENSTINTIDKYTNLTLSEKLAELEKNNYKVLSDEEEQILIQTIAKIAREELSELKSKPETKEFILTLENAMKQEAKNSISNAVDSQKVSMATVKELEAYSVEQQDAYISANLSQYSAQIAAVQANSNNKLTKLEALKTIILVSNSTLDTVKNKANKTIDNINSDNATAIENTVEEAVNKYIQSVTIDIMQAFNLQNKDQFNQLENKMKDLIIRDLIKKVSQDETMKGLSQKLQVEIKAEVDTVSTNVATELAKTYTSTLANEIAKNMIEKHFGETQITDSEIDKELSKYENVINEKLKEVDTGIITLQDALDQLTNGATQLEKGATKLSKGMEEFDATGISKISSYINGNLKNLQVRIQKLQEISEEYTNFSGIEDGVEGSTKFILTIDSMNEKTKQQNSKLPENNGQNIENEYQTNKENVSGE